MIDRGAVAWIGPFYVFDPIAMRPAVVADAMAARASDGVMKIRSLHARHDFVHAYDVGSAVIDVLQHDLRGAIDVGSGVSRSVVDVVGACGARWQDGEGSHHFH
jgi:nucleoside-diphosphate-sugar epimerase